jgi:hypothetical protein
MPPARSLKVLHAPALQGGIRRVSQTKIYILETNEVAKKTSRHFHFVPKKRAFVAILYV